MKPKVAICIPARYQSERFPGKVLAPLGGKPVLWHVWNKARQVSLASEVVITVDSQEVMEVAVSWGAHVLMTDPSCKSGMQRTASIIDHLKADFVINLQGDEPFINPAYLDQMIEQEGKVDADIITLVFKITQTKDLLNPNLVKAVRAHTGKALYFSRQPIPYIRDIPKEKWCEYTDFFGHYGIYGCKRSLLEAFDTLPHSPLEDLERLEQLRFMEQGYSIYTLEVKEPSRGIDTPQDLIDAQALITQTPFCNENLYCR